MTAGMPELGDLERLTANLRRFSEDTQRRAAQFQQVADSLGETSVTEHGESGAVRATVSASGALTDLELTERARELPATQLASAIMGCVQRAQARIADRAQQIVDETVSDDSPQAAHIAQNIVAGFRDRFPAPAAPATAEPAENAPDVGTLAERSEDDQPGPRRAPSPEEDDTGERGPFLS